MHVIPLLHTAPDKVKRAQTCLDHISEDKMHPLVAIVARIRSGDVRGVVSHLSTVLLSYLVLRMHRTQFEYMILQLLSRH